MKNNSARDLSLIAIIASMTLVIVGVRIKHFPSTPPQTAVAKSKPAIGGEFGKALDSIEATLVAGDKALTVPVEEKPNGIVIHDSGARVLIAPTTSKPPTFLTEAQVRQMQEDAKARQRQQKPISPPEK